MWSLQAGKKGGGQVVLEERIRWRGSCISGMSQANYTPGNPLFYLFSAFLSLRPLLPLPLTFPLSNFSISALTIHVLSAATDHYMILVCAGRFYLPVLQ